MIVIDEKKIFEIIEKRNPTSFALNGPDGLLHKVQDFALICLLSSSDAADDLPCVDLGCRRILQHKQ